MTKMRAVSVLLLIALLTVAYLVLSGVNQTNINERVNQLPFILFPIVGAVLLARHPKNPVGYLTSLLGLAVMGASVAFEYALMRIDPRFNHLPFTDFAVIVSLSLWAIVLPTLVFIFLYFPNGQMPGRGWKWLGVAAVAVTAPVLAATLVIGWRNRALLIFMDTGRIPYTAEVANLFTAYDIWNPVMIVIIILALISFFNRFSRSTGIERQQLKWFVFGLSTIPVSLIVGQFSERIPFPEVQAAAQALDILSIAAFPLVMLIAITRHRLYDIDIIIRRTLLYSAITLTLGLVYIGLILAMQQLFTQRFGEQPTLVIVISTLLIAAMFQPLRRRFQATIDRRFYRSKYDAEQTLERFASFLQGEVDIEQISRSLMTIVEENIQPEQVTLCLVKPAPETLHRDP